MMWPGLFLYIHFEANGGEKKNQNRKCMNGHRDGGHGKW